MSRPSTCPRCIKRLSLYLAMIVFPWGTAGAGEPLSRLVDSRLPGVYDNAETVEAREVVQRSGQILRTDLLKTDFKYPFVQVDTTLQRDPTTGQYQVMERKEFAADHLIVKLQSTAREGDFRVWSNRQGLRILKKMRAPGLYLVACPSNGMDAVASTAAVLEQQRNLVVYAEPDFLVHAHSQIPNDPFFDQLYGMHNTGANNGTVDADIDAPEVWALYTGNLSILVGIIDSGIDYNHPDLAANIWTHPGESGQDAYGRDKRTNGLDDDGNGFVDDYRGWDFISEDNNPMDDNSHGTHCAGTIGGVGNNAIGVAGVNWQVSLVGLKFLNAGGSGYTSDAVEAIYYANSLGVRLTSNSWGGGGYAQSMLNAIEAANNAGILFVAAAGNSGSNNDLSPHYPSNYTNANIIAVAATDRNDNRASFSCYGASSVDLGAPGVDIYSTTPDNGYGNKSGTSMAAPHVAGAAALLWSALPDTPHTDIKNVLLAGVDPLPSLDGNTVSGGRLNVRQSLLLLGLQVTDSSPSQNEIVDHPSTNVILYLNSAYAPASVQAIDLLLNNTPADFVDLVDATTLQFRFAVSPVSNDGVQSLSMAKGAITRQADGSGIKAWAASFRYDSLFLQVTAAIPSNTALVQLPWTNLIFLLNESIASDTVGPNDVILSRGQVTSAQQTDSNRLEYGLSGIEGESILTFSIPAKSWTDSHGNPSLPYNGSNELDIATAPCPNPLEAYPPLGSLIYGSAFYGQITRGYDVDTYTLTVNTGQTLAVVAEADTDLRSILALISPSGFSTQTVTATAPGQPIFLTTGQTESGVYQIRINSAGDSTGCYTLRILLNALVEEEPYTGATNDTRDLAQDMDPGFISLIGNASRGAAIGDVSDGEDWYRFSMTANQSITLALHSFDGDIAMGLYNEFGELLAEGNRDCINVTEYISGYLATTTAAYYARITGDGPYRLAVLRNAAFDLEFNTFSAPQILSTTGIVLGAVNPGTGSGMKLYYSFNEKEEGLVRDMSGYGNTGTVAGATFISNGYLRGAYDFDGIDDYIFAKNHESINLTNELTIASWVQPESFKSWMSWVSKGDAQDIHSQWRVGYGEHTYQWGLTWWDGGSWNDYWTRDTIPLGAWSFVCLAADSSARIIRLYRNGIQVGAWDNTTVNFLPSTNRLYIGFQKDNQYYFNGQIDEVQIYDRALTSNEVYALFTGEADDFFGLELQADNRITAQSFTPFDNSPEFRNPLDPALGLYDPRGIKILSDDNGAPDGHNAQFSHIISTSGVYTLGINSTAGNGEYLLQISSRILDLQLPSETVEGDDPHSARVVTDAPMDDDLTIFLTSITPTEATVPASVTLPVGETSAVFSITIVDDSLLDGMQTATILASADEVGCASRSFKVQDNETAALSVHLPETAEEGAGLLEQQGILAVSAPVDRDVLVQLKSDHTNEVTVPPFVVIPTGQTSTLFDLTIHEDQIIDGIQAAHIEASVTNWTSGNGTISVLDNESTQLLLLVPQNVPEGAGALTGQVQTAGLLISNLVVHFSSDQPARVSLPSEVILLAGQTSAVLTVDIPDNADTEGTTPVGVMAHAAGFQAGTNVIVVTDDDVHHFDWDPIPSPQRVGRGFEARITARSIDGYCLTSYTGPAFLSAEGTNGVASLSPTTITAFCEGTWSGSLIVGTNDMEMVLTASDGAGHTGQSLPFSVIVPGIGIYPQACVDIPIIAGTVSNCIITLVNHSAKEMKVTVLSMDISGEKLALWYSFDRDEGGLVEDLSGCGHTGFVEGASHTTNGQISGAYSFDGINDYIWADGAGDLNITNELTICAWVKPTAFKKWTAWMAKGNTNNTASQWRVGYGSYSYQWGLTMWNEETWVDRWNNESIPAGIWTHASMTAAPQEGNIRLYKNGGEVSSWTNPIGFHFISSTNRLNIGHQWDNDIYFSGTIDEILIFRRMLASNEISALYNGNPWITIPTPSITLPVGSSTNIVVTLHSAQLTNYAYRTTALRVTYNDPDPVTVCIPVSFRIVEPDLLVESMVSTNLLELGQSLELSYTLINTGNVTAAESWTAFYLSSNDTWEAHDYLFENMDAIPSMPPHTPWGNTVTLTLPGPDVWGSGVQHIIAQADAFNAVMEKSGESNNCRASDGLAVIEPGIVEIAVYSTNTENHPILPLGFDACFEANALLRYGYSKEITTSALWQSSATNVVQMSATQVGRAISVGGGTSWVTAVYQGYTSSPQIVCVTEPIRTHFIVLPSTLTDLHVGTTQSLQAIMQYSDGSHLPIEPDFWLSSDTNVATVHPDGRVTAEEAGTASICATEGGLTSCCASVVVLARFSGTITADGTPIGGASIAYSGPVSGVIPAGPDGAYESSWLSAGTYQVAAIHSNYCSASSLPVTLGPNQTGLDCVLLTKDMTITPSRTNWTMVMGCISNNSLRIANDSACPISFSVNEDGMNFKAGKATSIVVGAWDLSWSGTLRDRGNVFQATNTTMIQSLEMYLSLPNDTPLVFFAYEGTSTAGSYRKVAEKQIPSAGPGEQWYSSGNMLILLRPGYYYYLGVAWSGNATYGRGGLYPLLNSLGRLIGGIPITTAGFPPADSLTIGSSVLSTPPYYQRMTCIAPPEPTPMWVWPANGTIPFGTNTDIHLIMDASSLEAGTQIERHLILSDDTSLTTHDIPVAMIVLPWPPILTVPDFFMGSSNDIRWETIPGAHQYWAECSLNPDMLAGTNSGWVTTNHYSFPGVMENTCYYYRAKAAVTNSVQRFEGAWSDIVNIPQLSYYEDWDGDGLDNQSEIFAGTSPLDNHSVFSLLGFQTTGANLGLVWIGGTGVSQYLEFSDNLCEGNWECVYTNTVVESVTNSWPLNTTEPQGIYRLSVSPPP